MGVDVTMKARLHDGPIGAEEFEGLRRAFAERWPPDPYYAGQDYCYPDLGFDTFEPVQTIEAKTLWRFYGVGYERGPWPEIREMGDWLAVQIGERGEVRYGSDINDEWDALRPWADVREECEAQWVRVGNEPYLAHFRGAGSSTMKGDG